MRAFQVLLSPSKKNLKCTFREELEQYVRTFVVILLVERDFRDQR